MSAYVHMAPQRGWMEPARKLAAASVVAGYTAIGTPADHPCRIDSIYNLTDNDVWISLDGTNDHFVVLAGGGSVKDRVANGIELPKGTQFYVKRYTAGTVHTGGEVIVSISYRV